MSAYNTEKRKALDENLPLAHRSSHMRSCVNKVANTLGISRVELGQKAEEHRQINLNNPANNVELIAAIFYLDELRKL